ncbi:hypothetical protein LCGC14_0698620 [marine sediment metagenome]|uniref:DUF932 domain-containing protein n=1 Tax=marine sediment metagenome TaxID=412755 RepID=A0A0F9TRA7_9ZZZZ
MQDATAVATPEETTALPYRGFNPDGAPSSKTNLMEASKQWWSRPDDERFLSLEELHASTLERADRSDVQLLRSEEITAHGRFAELEGEDMSMMVFETPEGITMPTNWSFGQLCRQAKFDSRTAIRTHPKIAADGINYGLREVNPSEDCLAMTMTQNGEQVFRAVTSSGYGRIYDHKVVEMVQRMNDRQGNRWKIPGASYASSNPRRATTLYASDRDCFIFLVDESTPIEVPHPNRTDGHETLFRGFFLWNSEVGKTSFGLATFLYNFVCDNRIVWGAQDVKELRIRHTSGAPERFEREGQAVLRKYAAATLDETRATVQKAITTKVGSTDDEVLEWLGKRGFTKAQGGEVMKAAAAEEGEARSVWDLVQGGTALARQQTHTDSRLDTEKRASALLNTI